LMLTPGAGSGMRSVLATPLGRVEPQLVRATRNQPLWACMGIAARKEGGDIKLVCFIGLQRSGSIENNSIL
jgi:hypothetical protein